MILHLLFVIFLILYLLIPRLSRNTVAFFHPNADARGGGEKVLWYAIRTIADNYPDLKIVIFINSNKSERDILLGATTSFGINLLDIKFIRLRLGRLLKPSPFFTLILQAIGGFIVSCEAAFKKRPRIFIDTSGHAWTYPIFRFLSSEVVAYVHYPFISTDMISRVSESSYNNQQIIANSSKLIKIKRFYYWILSNIYGFFGTFASHVAVNSSWTKSHIDSLWGIDSQVIYPPCDIPEEYPNNLIRSGALSIGQFRPEKNHELQINTIKLAPNIKLKMVGSCRNIQDRIRARDLRKKSINLPIEILTGVPYNSLLDYLKTSLIGIHTMKDEHFGISVVEMLSHGCITIAHNSAGPKWDIIKNGETGFLADNAEDYAKYIIKIQNMTEKEREKIRNAARLSCERFSNENFIIEFNQKILNYIV